MPPVVTCQRQAAPLQGASPAEVRQKVNVAATPDAVADDPEGWGTWDPASRPGAVDISTTPNRLLTTALASQALLAPGVLAVDPATAGLLSLSLTLAAQPAADVIIRWAAVGVLTLLHLADARLPEVVGEGKQLSQCQSGCWLDSG